MYCLVSPFSKTFDDIGLFYIVPNNLEKDIKIGQIVEINIRNKLEIGVVLNLEKDIKIDFDKSKILEIKSIKNKNIFLSGYRLNLAKWIAKYYFTNIHSSINLFFPKNLKEKIKKDKLKIPEKIERDYNFNYKNILSDKQKEAFIKIKNSKNNKILFYGITGSGKTDIYINLIHEQLKKGKQTLLLIPEIILNNQIFEKLGEIFPNEIIIINSSVPEAKKTKYFLDIQKSNIKIIIGTRSALFYPYNDLGLIIIDEQHDNSYISDKSPRYNGVEVAEKITDLNGNKLLMASGTPSVNSMHKALKGDYELINLLEKY